MYLDACINRVPDGLREVNPRSYTPRLVAIGPRHRNDPKFKPMEDLKHRFLGEFLQRTNNSLDHITTFISRWIPQICYFYPEDVRPSSKDLCEMILLDSIFIIQIFLEKKNKNPIFYYSLWFCDLMHDFLLIENQIPVHIPAIIYNYYYCQSGGNHNHTDFSKMADNFFMDVKMASAPLPRLPYPPDFFSLPEKLTHFVEYLRMAYFLPNPSSQPISSQSISTSSRLPLTQKETNKEGNWKSDMANASKLLDYGVKFMVSKTSSLVEIQFKPQDGILKIPRIKVNDWTETLVRNLIAFEHCHHLTTRYVTDYVIFMDSLIDTPEDVNILTGAGILQDAFHDPEKVSVLFNNLYKEVKTENQHFYFAQLTCELNNYTSNWWLQWKAKRKAMCRNWMVILRDDYFNSPWSIISFLAAVILLGLTIVQTVCSIYQAKGIKM